MTTQQLKKSIAERVAQVPDQTPEEMLRRVLELLDELAKADGDKLERMERFFKNIDEDRSLLQRLAQ